MRFRAWVGSTLLLASVAGTGGGLVAWKRDARRDADAAAASQPEPVEAITVAVARRAEHRRSTTAIGTVMALRSVHLRNELPGTVREVRIAPGQVVEEGALLVALDTAVEEAELRALEAEEALAASNLERLRRANERRAAPAAEVDRAAADGDVARARIARMRAIIDRKTIRAPFRARTGLADLHPGQYLDAGSEITTLQGIDGAVHVEFSLPQRVAAGLAPGDAVEVLRDGLPAPLPAAVVAVDARVDETTRTARVRARLETDEGGPSPGSAVRVRVPVGPARTAVAVPVSALRRGPEGDHVFTVAPDAAGLPRASTRKVSSGESLGDEVLILDGLAPGETVAASGSFKLREGVRVSAAEADAPPAEGAR